MGDWPNRQPIVNTDGGFISTAAVLAGLNTTASASLAWPAANRALFVPFWLTEGKTVYKMTAGAGTTAAGNYDLGIYDRFGNRMVSTGTQAKGASTEMTIDVTDTFLNPGMYYLAMSADGTNNYIMLTPAGTTPVPEQKARAYGCYQMASAFVLPDPATFAAYATIGVPVLSAHFRSY